MTTAVPDVDVLDLRDSALVGRETADFCSEADIAALFDGVYPQLCRAVVRIIGRDLPTAEQVVMDAFVIVFERRRRIRRDTAAAYLWTVALNQARSTAVRESKALSLVDRATREGHLPGDLATASDRDPYVGAELGHVRALVDALPIDQRIVVVLHYFCDWPDAEIAAVVGCPAVTVRSRLRRARTALQRGLVRTGGVL